VPRNGTGGYALPSVTPPIQAGASIAAASMNTTLADLATAMAGSVAADGQTTMTGSLNMGSKTITGLANGTASGQAVSYSQFPATLASPGTTTLPNGLIMKWGTGTITLGVGAVVFAAAFPTATLNVQITINGAAAPIAVSPLGTGTVTVAGFDVWGNAVESFGFYWQAIGH